MIAPDEANTYPLYHKLQGKESGRGEKETDKMVHIWGYSAKRKENFVRLLELRNFSYHIYALFFKKEAGIMLSMIC